MPNDASWKEILKAIRQAASNLIGLPLEQIDRKASFPSQGLDSLHVLKLSRALRDMVRAHQHSNDLFLWKSRHSSDIHSTALKRREVDGPADHGQPAHKTGEDTGTDQ